MKERERRIALDAKTQATVDELMPLIRRFTQAEYGIAVGGVEGQQVRVAGTEG